MTYVQLSLFGRTSQGLSAQTAEKISVPCWKSLPALKSQTLQFLDLRGGADGTKPEQSLETDGAWLGDSLTLNIGECPSAANESLLSWILQADAPEKYYLSAKACQGILTRASRRGKKLPELLENALLEMIEWWEPGSSVAVVEALIEEERKRIERKKAKQRKERVVTNAVKQLRTLLKSVRDVTVEAKVHLYRQKKTGTLSTLQDQTLFQLIQAPTYCISGNTVDRITNQNGTGVKENAAFTVNTVDRHAVAYKLENSVVFDARGNGDGKIVPTITGDHESRITDYTAIAVDLYNGTVTGEQTASLTCRSIGSHSGPQVAERKTFSEQSYDCFKQSEKGGTLKGSGGVVGYGGESLVSEKAIRWIVRRLTPTECERLQGYPDGWTDIGDWVDSKGKKHKSADTPRYKALGNSIALPQWFWIAQKMKRYLPADATLGSLFDGIGGFPLVWETTYGKGTARWASEIEEFPIAVTKKWFADEEPLK